MLWYSTRKFYGRWPGTQVRLWSSREGAQALSELVVADKSMLNPWLAIALEDYEGHMGSDQVRQLEPLSDLFKHTLDLCVPKSIALK